MARNPLDQSLLSLKLQHYAEEESKQIPRHFPWHNYLGPGTHIMENIQNGIEPINELDRIALVHDIEYVKPGNQLIADNNMQNNLSKTLLRYTSIPLMIKLAFKIKDISKIKENDYTDLEVYEYLKQLAKSKNMIGDYVFADD